MDPILDALLRQILERPDDDQPRLAYADQLDALGRADQADEIRRQIAEPEPGVPVAGASAGVEIADAVTVRRGFPEEITLHRDRISGLGDVLREHPVTTVWVRGFCLWIEFGAPPPEDLDDLVAECQWIAYVGGRVPHRDGIVHMMISAWRAWDSRVDLVRGISAWTASVLPPAPTADFGRPPAPPERPSAE
jgi:uncharacterized protein (TIGR02996 family)